MPILRKKRRSSEVLGFDESHHQVEKNEELSKVLPDLQPDMVNVSAGGLFYEKAKSRRVRAIQALDQSGVSSAATPLRRRSEIPVTQTEKNRSSKGPNPTASVSSSRHKHADDEGYFSSDNDVDRKGVKRQMIIRHQCKEQQKRQMLCAIVPPKTPLRSQSLTDHQSTKYGGHPSLAKPKSILRASSVQYKKQKKPNTGEYRKN